MLHYVYIFSTNISTEYFKRHFEEENRECAACLKYSVLIFVEKIYT